MRAATAERSPFRSHTMPLPHAFWDYLIWGDAAFTLFEWAIRKFAHFAFTVPGMSLLLTVTHAIFIFAALRLVFLNRRHSRYPLIRIAVFPFLILYTVLCLSLYVSYRELSSVATLHFLNAAVRLVHG